MYLDHPRISATRSETEPDRIERLNRVYGYAIGLADVDGNTGCIAKLSKIHDHKGILMVIWFTEPTEEEKGYFLKAWMSKVGDLSTHVEHEVLQQESLSLDA
ncbi:hypothetical protein [Undibacterium sp.]|jgi:hypothetical protein|uniref:hypothetical protein n=1 Tax=Undibacterium sp. TaxID=1914977 RepID=UPI002CE0289B|nr:hypothetical protein [Undibacterium sp.]HTD05326.1 hypothetical protein [Undibacterium sp.]